MSAAETSGEPITEEGLEALRTEVAELEGPGRVAMAARIKVAREEGDLKENAEYHIAKEDQAHLETRIKRLNERLHNAVVVEVDETTGDAFAFGRTAEVTRRVERRGQHLDPGRLDRGEPRRGAALSRVADRARADERQGRQDGQGRDPERLEDLRRREARRLVVPAPLVEFPADDPDRALRFWRGVLGAALEPRGSEAGEGWESEEGGLRLGVHERGRGPGDTASLPYFTVADLPATIERVGELGGTIVHPGERWAICRDSEGSPFALEAARPGG